MCMYKWKSW